MYNMLMQPEPNPTWFKHLTEYHPYHVVIWQREEEEGGEQRERKKKHEKETRSGRETEDRESLWHCRGDCDHASWILISKQNKYSQFLLLLLCSSHKPFQVPCRPFSHRDLYCLLAVHLSHLLFLSSPLFLLHFLRHSYFYLTKLSSHVIVFVCT